MAVMRLLPLFLLSSYHVNAEVPLSEFFSFGDQAGDSVLPPNDDSYSDVQTIGLDFTFFFEKHRNLYVNTNGLISFVRGVRSFTPQPFPKINDSVVLAPFWIDIDTRRCTSSCHIWYRESTHTRDLNKATSEIRRYFPVMQHFTASWTYIVTWDNVAFYGASALGLNKRNTFQAVLISDTKNAYVIYNYNKIEWITGISNGGNENTGLDGQAAQNFVNGGSSGFFYKVGFNMGDEVHYYTVEGSMTSNIINIPSMSNVGSPGKFVFRVDLEEIEPAPTPGTPGHCLLNAVDIAFVLDLSSSMDISALKTLITSLISYLPLSNNEFRIAMTSFSSKAKVEFYFNSYSQKTEMLAHIEMIRETKGTSNLKDGLLFTKQLYSRGSRSYAKRLVIVLTDGLLVGKSDLITEANNLKRFANVLTVALGKSVKHDLLEKIASNTESILQPSSSKIWRFLQAKYANPACLSCTSQMEGEIYFMMDGSSYITKREFEEGKQFIYSFVENIMSLNLQNVTMSVDVFQSEIIHAISLQNTSNLRYQLGRVAAIDFTGESVNQSVLLRYIQNTESISMSENRFFIFVSNGQFLDTHLIEAIKNSIDNNSTFLLTVGLGQNVQWDNMESLASHGYFVFSHKDTDLLARHLPKEMTTILCS